MPPKKRNSLRDSVSKASQPSTSSKTERRPTTLVEEPLILLSHGSLRSQAHHPPRSPVLPSLKRLKLTNSSLPTSVPNLTHFTLMPMLPMPTQRTRSLSFTPMMPHALLLTELQPQDSFSSENSKPPPTFTPVLLIRMLSLHSSSH